MFASSKPVIGMIHVEALPGTPANEFSLGKIIAAAVREARIYRNAGVDGVALENMRDVPYLRGTVGPEIVASMSVIAQAVKAEFRGVTGIQILAAANREALAVAQAAGLDWVRVEGFAFRMWPTRASLIRARRSCCVIENRSARTKSRSGPTSKRNIPRTPLRRTFRSAKPRTRRNSCAPMRSSSPAR